MRAFLSVLETGKTFLEGRENQIRLRRACRLILGPACLILAGCLAWFRWDVFLVAALGPVILLFLAMRKRAILAMPVVARVFDSSYQLRDILATAAEFQPQEGVSPVLHELMAEADLKSRAISFPAAGWREKLEKSLLIFLFVFLLLMNLWRFWGGNQSANPLDGLQEQLSGTNQKADEKKGMQSILEQMKNAGSDQHFQEAADNMSKSIDRADPTDALKKVGNSLAKSNPGKDVGKALSEGKIGEGSQKAREMAENLNKGVPKDQKEGFENSLKEARDSLQGGALPDVQQALDDMGKNLNSPEELKKSAENLANKLDEAAKKQKDMQDLKNKLEEAKKQAPGNQGRQGQQGRQGGKKGESKEGKPGSEEKGHQEAKSGDKPGEKKGDKPGQQGNQEKPGQQQVGQEKSGQKGSQAKNAPQKNGAPLQDGKGGKGAGGVLAEDLEKMLKEKGKNPKPEQRIMDNQGEYERGSGSQLLADYEKGVLLTDQEKGKMKSREETLTKSREVDEFSRRYRIPPSFRNYLKDFFVQPGSASRAF